MQIAAVAARAVAGRASPEVHSANARRNTATRRTLRIIEHSPPPKFKKRFENAVLIGEVQGFGLPLASKKRKLSGDGYMLTGDAASLIDPLTGEGIANALLSGAVAAEQAAQCLTKQDFSASILREYDERIYRMRGREFKVSYRLQQWFKNERFFNTLLWLIAKNKSLARTFAYVFNDTNLKKQLWKPSWWWSVLSHKKDINR